MSGTVDGPAMPEDDKRFTFGLAYDVEKVLEAHGYPKIEAPDFVALQQALFRLLYRDTTLGRDLLHGRDAPEVPDVMGDYQRAGWKIDAEGRWIEPGIEHDIEP